MLWNGTDVELKQRVVGFSHSVLTLHLVGCGCVHGHYRTVEDTLEMIHCASLMDRL